jgi:hypothetical protein
MSNLIDPPGRETAAVVPAFLEQWSWIAEVICPGIELAQDDGGNEQATSVLDKPMRQPARTPKMSRTDVGVEQVAHSSPI